MRVCSRCRSIYSSQIDRCLNDGERLRDEGTYPLIGETLDRYRVVSAIGEGGMGCVYRATHTVLPREYAIKVLFRDYAGNAMQIERFRREAQAASTITHPNIVSVGDFVSLPDGLTFIVMELVEGRTLELAIQNEAPFSPLRAAKIVKMVATGLGEAHRMGFVHRDVKPSNIMLSNVGGEETVKILDFGVVGIGSVPLENRLTGVGHIIGTPAYMAPEQMHDPSVGPGADFYALGVILYEMLTGETPFGGADRMSVFLKHMNEPPPPLAPASGLEMIATWLLEKSPDKRPSRADELIRAIDRLELTEIKSSRPVDRGTENTSPTALNAMRDTVDSFKRQQDGPREVTHKVPGPPMEVTRTAPNPLEPDEENITVVPVDRPRNKRPSSTSPVMRTSVLETHPPRFSALSEGSTQVDTPLAMLVRQSLAPPVVMETTQKTEAPLRPSRIGLLMEETDDLHPSPGAITHVDKLEDALMPEIIVPSLALGALSAPSVPDLGIAGSPAELPPPAVTAPMEHEVVLPHEAFVPVRPPRKLRMGHAILLGVVFGLFLIGAMVQFRDLFAR